MDGAGLLKTQYYRGGIKILLFLTTLLLIVGSWIWFNYNLKKGISQFFLVITSIGTPFLFFYGGINYAAYISSQGAAFGSAILLYVLLANSIILMIFIAVIAIRKNGRNE
ncbi:MULTISPECIES: hypothetical protein [Halobacillus]|uniref:hypothetical protein n=1 Tax=Halobacillus TaxID=45667 RepID=UPI001369D310|nr:MULTISPECIES: hypothetical protein [Halobacillus]MYL31284.1 hypothetical protein [Halobacillus halophilus]MYL39603.1 hypothetical protein [Halobacillus litoralis]